MVYWLFRGEAFAFISPTHQHGVALRPTHNRNSRQLLNKPGCAPHMSRLIDSRDQFIGQLLARFGKLDFLRQQ